jgi:hypothetical protein
MPDTANPLSGRVPNAPGRPKNEHPQMMHAKMWQHVSGMEPGAMASAMQKTAATLPLIGSLAANPKVTSKDVIKAAAEAAATGHIQPSDAVKFITNMPAEPDHLRPWLRSMYQANLSAMVHMKAAAMAPPQQAMPQQAPQAAMPMAPPGGALNG